MSDRSGLDELFRWVGVPRTALKSMFRSPKAALHQGQVTFLKMFRIMAMSRVNRMTGWALWNLR